MRGHSKRGLCLEALAWLLLNTEQYCISGLKCNANLKLLNVIEHFKYMFAFGFAGVSDNVEPPSSRLFVGRPIACGTGSFELCVDMQ